MAKIKWFCLVAIACLGIAGFAKAMVVKYNAALVNEAGLTYNKSYPIPLASYGIDYLSFTSVASSVTFSNQTFTDGQQSTGSITVTTTTGLGALAASDFLTVQSTTALFLTSTTMTTAITLNGIVLTQGLQWFSDLTSSQTAISIAHAINANVSNVVASTGSGGTVYATATVSGLYGNNMVFSANVSTNVISFNTYTSSTSTSSSSQFSGGQNAAAISINGIGIPFTTQTGVGGSSTTATSIVNSINSNAFLNTIIVATNNTTGTIIFATSTVAGLFTNYTITSSTDAALTVGGATKTVTGLNGASIGQMWGGKDPSFFLNQGSATVINIASHGYTLGLPVQLTGSNLPTGLTANTTYFVIPVTSNALSLSATSTGAVAGLAVVLTSSRTTTTADIYTLSPLAITGTPSYRWEVSNDGMNWIPYTTTSNNVSVSSISLSVYNSTGTINSWDFGQIGYAFIRLNVTSPTQGAIKLQVFGDGKQEGQFQ